MSTAICTLGLEILDIPRGYHTPVIVVATNSRIVVDYR